jgi:hypothetical protein
MVKYNNTWYRIYTRGLLCPTEHKADNFLVFKTDRQGFIRGKQRSEGKKGGPYD